MLPSPVHWGKPMASSRAQRKRLLHQQHACRGVAETQRAVAVDSKGVCRLCISSCRLDEEHAGGVSLDNSRISLMRHVRKGPLDVKPPTTIAAYV